MGKAKKMLMLLRNHWTPTRCRSRPKDLRPLNLLPPMIVAVRARKGVTCDLLQRNRENTLKMRTTSMKMAATQSFLILVGNIIIGRLVLKIDWSLDLQKDRRVRR